MSDTFLAVMLGAIVNDALQGVAVDSEPIGGITSAHATSSHAIYGGFNSDDFRLIGNLDEMVN